MSVPSSAESSPPGSRAACSSLCGTSSSLRNPWPNAPRLPRGPAAVLAALHLGDPRPESLARLDERDWRQALLFSNQSQITLALRRRARGSMPEWVREVTDGNLSHNRDRLQRLVELYRWLAQTFTAQAIDLHWMVLV